ncbi:preprotein translocase subunit SecE [Sporomusaceae bacterium BoRhaA]|jgi:preprotein translocase subunit SecE|uniref:preprotein translocase subunit SecE n=1 Tax=Pelorhabdus rhamnosifermentans TaxID=2772457 RepID=UPI001C06086E|nr:preprotein translocase subunit SecE [Pelorhabdus rhamnosifermentans]MBU2701602.1 preprotein translocase subunit SecE [Pelorhabdus rhamnosifermentans]
MATQETAMPQGTPRFKKFFREVKAELKKVSWPNKQELISYTGVVFVSVIFIAALIWVVDSVFNEALRLILK